MQARSQMCVRPILALTGTETKTTPPRCLQPPQAIVIAADDRQSWCNSINRSVIVVYRCHRSWGLNARARILEKLPEAKDRGLLPSSRPRGRAWFQPASLPLSGFLDQLVVFPPLWSSADVP